MSRIQKKLSDGENDEDSINLSDGEDEEGRTMMQMKQMNRKTATKVLLVQWSRFQRLCVNLEGSTLFTGVNGSGKSTILDAMTYLLTGNRQFNKAAKDRDRTVLA